MNRIVTSLVANLLIVAAGTPAVAQQAGSPPNSAVCTGDYICVDSTVVPTWPLERWTQVRRQTKQETASATPAAPPRVPR